MINSPYHMLRCGYTVELGILVNLVHREEDPTTVELEEAEMPGGAGRVGKAVRR